MESAFKDNFRYGLVGMNQHIFCLLQPIVPNEISGGGLCDLLNLPV